MIYQRAAFGRQQTGRFPKLPATILKPKSFDYKNILYTFVPHFEVVCALNCKAEP